MAEPLKQVHLVAELACAECVVERYMGIDSEEGIEDTHVRT
jgi:hypothetical protein